MPKNNFNLVIVFFILFSWVGCKSTAPERITDNETRVAPKRMEDLKVADGFNFVNTQEVKFNLRFEDNEGEGVNGLIVSIGNYDNEGRFYRIYTNMTNEEGRLETWLDVPLHFKNLMVRYFYIGETRQLEVKKKSEIVESIQLAGI